MGGRLTQANHAASRNFAVTGSQTPNSAPRPNTTRAARGTKVLQPLRSATRGPHLREAQAEDLDAFARLMHLAFGGPRDDSRSYVDRIPSAYRRVWDGGAHGTLSAAPAPAAALVAIPMGHYFGGRRVASVGVQAVAVAPEARGGGVAKTMLAALLADMAGSGREGGAAISTLYASVQSLYRALGYEHSGVYAELSINLRMLPRAGRSGNLIALGPDHDEAVRTLYNQIAPCFDGSVDRDPYLWSRVWEAKGTRYEGLGILANATRSARVARSRALPATPAIDGYLYVAPERDASSRSLAIRECAFRDVESGRRLLRALADFAPTMTVATLAAAPNHPLATLLEQQWHSWRIKDLWMLRIIDLAKAIEQRGYRRGVDVAFRVEVDDDVLASNSGRWVIEVAGGRGTARRPTRVDDQPLLKSGPRGLATIWSGFLTPRQAQLQGLLSGAEDALALAESAFAGPMPAMTDAF